MGPPRGPRAGIQRTDYLGIHEERWRKLRAAGAEGWSAPEDLRQLLAFVTEALASEKVPRGVCLLDLGCGEGRIAFALEEAGLEVHGLEIAPTAAAWAAASARRRGSRARFVRANAVVLPYRSACFDVLLGALCLHCIVGEDRGRFLREALRVLRPGGLLLLETMCGDRMPPGMRAGFDPCTRILSRGGIAGRVIAPPEAILAELRAAGFLVGRWAVIEDAEDPEETEDLQVAARRPA